MRKLIKPKEDAIDIFSLCISKVQKQELKDKLEACELSIIDAVEVYDRKASLTELHTIERHDVVNSNVTQKEMEKVYTDRMVGQSSPGRVIYNRLLSSAPNNICPLCAQRVVNTLEHHLPKAHFPVYSVVPINIFPCCSACNKSKLSFFPDNQNEEPIHPYYDDFDNDLWLKAEVIESDIPSVKYYTQKPEGWTDVKYDRINNHFELMGLDSLYASHSGVELAEIKHNMIFLFNNGGSDLVKNFLENIYLSNKKFNLNSWRTALYHALSNSNWYINGGFKI
ncbi:hypothetical protein V3A08_14995 [Tenacibaculum maritimum]|uniref:hypothetical protein n=1 Tax=Tenacibaculum maritimum TaxID=107401 RepID=UPI003876D064